MANIKRTAVDSKLLIAWEIECFRGLDRLVLTISDQRN
jgi:hypothetical protein